MGAGRHTCSLLLAQQRTREQPTMPVMKMARLKLKIAKTSIAAAQHFMSLSAAALIFDGVSVRVERRLARGERSGPERGRGLVKTF